MLPITALMLVLSPADGCLAQRTGPQVPMTVGPIIAGAGLALMACIAPGAGYLTVVLPAVAVFGLGLSLTVTRSARPCSPRSARIRQASPRANNAVARLAGLFAVAVLPLLAGLSSTDGRLGPGIARAMLIAAAACAAGGLVAWATIPSRRTHRP